MLNKTQLTKGLIFQKWKNTKYWRLSLFLGSLIEHFSIMEEEPKQVNFYFLKVLGLRSFRVIYTMLWKNKWEISGEGKGKQTTKLDNRAVCFLQDMENSHLTVTVATLSQVFYPFPEINNHKNVSDTDVNNTVLLCSAFHTVPWFSYSSAQWQHQQSSACWLSAAKTQLTP